MHAPSAGDSAAITSARVVLPCAQLTATCTFFVEQLGFRLDSIMPADDPRTAVLSGHGLTLELRRGSDGPPGTLHLLRAEASSRAARGGADANLVAPNGTRIEWGDARGAPAIPPLRPEFVVCHARTSSPWVTGRAGMRYRDLLPGRLGGRFVASQIRIETGGPVPDSVHFHAIRFQLIYCLTGWVRVAYQDQGPACRMVAGDCFLQPPGIRHRVLESSAGLEVLEVSCPAEHDTHFDHDLALPTGSTAPGRDFGGQRFVHHVAANAAWQPCEQAGWQARDTGIDAATRGLAAVAVLRCGRGSPSRRLQHGGELLFLYVLAGSCTLVGGPDGPQPLQGGDSLAVPSGSDARLEDTSANLQLLEVHLPPPSRP